MPGIGLVILALVMGIFCNIPKPKQWQHWFWRRVGRAVVGVCATFFLGTIMGGCLVLTHDQYFKAEVSGVQPIVNVHDSLQFSGSGFIFLTSVNGGPAYAYFVENPPGDLQQRYMDTRNVIIREISGKETGDLKTYQDRYTTNSWMKYWIRSGTVLRSSRYVFEVPEGTVKRGFSLGG
ncbi:MAG: hypothetical protein A3I39_00240 [Candidatus Yanofskybacteria bacterium RIFCSPLOWO2_02_FULL_47_9b]|uniref:Transmembrane protein n=1 Tax=Candidatus Yanofskybacteria bacterium RIFCSPLOWO2_02_FULL_47_9b TaxID=1802708 RepID=A0A1F8HB23_9BACT|nr:MAG: hypothetical protein A3I39_00240 [Candidatus Yanofskybacteria bacterium RIFCSPLOWO2_02_FULL_47_9b]